MFGWNIFVNDKSAADISKDILWTVATRKARLHIIVGALSRKSLRMFGVMSASAVADKMIYHTDCDIPRVYRGYLLESKF
ncbi:MAG: hypothetical protein OXC46_04885 [Thaumarchaeota archaeon]|nr:hypothetical protein [Nitrososphaerota archaeon]